MKSKKSGVKNSRFLHVKKNTLVKKPKNGSEIARENHFLPVKFSENHTREKFFGAREENQKIPPSKRLNVTREKVFYTRAKIPKFAREKKIRA